MRAMPFDDGWPAVWQTFGDARREETLFHYLWLAETGPNKGTHRIDQLIAEAERRGRPELVDRARASAEESLALYRDLVAAQPSVHSDGLATALDVAAVCSDGKNLAVRGDGRALGAG